MLRRKFTYASYAVLMLAGLAGTFVLYRMLVHGSILYPVGAASSMEAMAQPSSGSKENADRTVANDHRGKTWDRYFQLEYLLKDLGTGRIFGRYRLKGIIADNDAPESSRAVIEDLDEGTRRAYSLHDRLPDNSWLAAIKRNYVILEKNGIRRRLSFGSHEDDSGGLDKMETEGREGYRKIGDSEFILNPYRAFKGNADQILDFSMHIYSSRGVMEGIQISGLKPGSPAHVLGLREGDVLLEVNDNPVDSLLNGIVACMNAHKSDDVLLRLRREGRLVTLTYHLFWNGRGTWTPKSVLQSRAVASLFNNVSISHVF